MQQGFFGGGDGASAVGFSAADIPYQAMSVKEKRLQLWTCHYVCPCPMSIRNLTFTSNTPELTPL